MFENKKISLALFIILALYSHSILGIEVPERLMSKDHPLIYDYSYLLSSSEIKEIAHVQSTSYAIHKKPVVLVIISKMSDYNHFGSIETFSKTWFDSWGIGDSEKNDGMLLLVSIFDRKARIELGAAWGNRWDRVTQQIMMKTIIPHLKANNYFKAMLEGVKKLGKMGLKNPKSTPTKDSLLKSKIKNIFDKIFSFSFSKKTKYFLFILGALFMILSIFSTQHKGKLLILGIVLIITAIFIKLLLGLGCCYLASQGLKSSEGSFGGGLSGGGGSTGGW